jgi:alpha-L-arabinofuranosidase B-like protein
MEFARSRRPDRDGHRRANPIRNRPAGRSLPWRGRHEITLDGGHVPAPAPAATGPGTAETDSSPLPGTGWDNSHGGQGEFLEGAITAGHPGDATKNAAQTGIVTAPRKS